VEGFAPSRLSRTDTRKRTRPRGGHGAGDTRCLSPGVPGFTGRAVSRAGGQHDMKVASRGPPGTTRSARGDPNSGPDGKTPRLSCVPGAGATDRERPGFAVSSPPRSPSSRTTVVRSWGKTASAEPPCTRGRRKRNRYCVFQIYKYIYI